MTAGWGRPINQNSKAPTHWWVADGSTLCGSVPEVVFFGDKQREPVPSDACAECIDERRLCGLSSRRASQNLKKEAYRHILNTITTLKNSGCHGQTIVQVIEEICWAQSKS